MSVKSKLTEISKNFKQKGSPAVKNIRKNIMKNFTDDSYSSQALRYFAEVTLPNALPVFPALIAMSCEAMGEDIEKTVPFGEAIVLISAAADLHDDVIDQSSVKSQRQTVLGKFNSGTAILTGDILLTEGFRRLTDASESIPKVQSKEIIKLVSEAVIEICTAEALEIKLHRRFDLTPSEYQEIIRLKAVVPELAMKIGAIVGNGNLENVEALGQFGRIYGINSLIIEEFADLLNNEELKNRVKSECVPLPVIYALQNPQIKTNLLPLLEADLSNESIQKKIVDLTLDSQEVDALQKILVANATEGLKKLPSSANRKIREELENLLLVPLNYFET
jgi:geranylgeranyl pyrophosphate synthase